MQEEIAHCAAGVRWLTYLHRQACSAVSTHDSVGLAAQLQHTNLASNVPVGHSKVDNSSLQNTCSHELHPATTTPALDAAAGSTHEPMQGACANGVSCDGQRPGAAPGRGTDSQATSQATSHLPCIPNWQADAQRYSTVEEWFHALVRAHFKGSLKVCSMDSALCSWRWDHSQITQDWFQLAYIFSAVVACNVSVCCHPWCATLCSQQAYSTVHHSAPTTHSDEKVIAQATRDFKCVIHCISSMSLVLSVHFDSIA